MFSFNEKAEYKFRCVLHNPQFCFFYTCCIHYETCREGATYLKRKALITEYLL